MPKKTGPASGVHAHALLIDKASADAGHQFHSQAVVIAPDNFAGNRYPLPVAQGQATANNALAGQAIVGQQSQAGAADIQDRDRTPAHGQHRIASRWVGYPGVPSSFDIRSNPI